MSTYLRCSGCGLTFSSERAFVAHRTGAYARGRQPAQRRCLTKDELHRVGLVANPAKSRGERVVWSVGTSLESWRGRHGQFSQTPDIKFAPFDAPPSPPSPQPAPAVLVGVVV